MRTVKVVVAALAMMVAVNSAAVAQDQLDQGLWSGPMPGFGYPTPGMTGYGRNSSGQTRCNGMAGHIEGRLAFIKTELKITPAQESLWNAYAAAAHDSANAMLARCTAMASQRSNAAVRLPDRLDQNEQLMAAQLNVMRALNAALKPLYAALSDEQKKSADQLFRGPMGMM